MRIIVDIDDATGAVTIIPETQDPEDVEAEPEPAPKTVTLTLAEPVATAGEAQHALTMAAMNGLLPDSLTGVHVVVDVTGVEAAAPAAIREIVMHLYWRNVKSIEFVADDNEVAGWITYVITGEDVATLLPVTLVDNSVEPEPEPERPVPHNATIGDTTYEWQPAVSELVIDHDDGKGWTIDGVIPDLYVWNVGCEHGKRAGECDARLIDPAGVRVPTRDGLVFIPAARVNGAQALASWLAEVFEKGKA